MKKIILILLAGVVSAAMVGVAMAQFAPFAGFGGASGGSPLPLLIGGKITTVEYCCNGVAIEVEGPRPGRFLFTAGSILYAYYNIFEPGPNVLGTAVPGEQCQTIYSYCTTPSPVLGRIVQIGTSSLQDNLKDYP